MFCGKGADNMWLFLSLSGEQGSCHVFKTYSSSISMETHRCTILGSLISGIAAPKVHSGVRTQTRRG